MEDFVFLRELPDEYHELYRQASKSIYFQPCMFVLNEEYHRIFVCNPPACDIERFCGAVSHEVLHCVLNKMEEDIASKAIDKCGFLMITTQTAEPEGISVTGFERHLMRKGIWSAIGKAWWNF